MGKSYTVKQGDNLSKIAKKHGYSSWRVIYNHPENAAFRRKRRDPNRIRPGDVLVLPPLKPSGTPAAALRLPWNFASQLSLPTKLPLIPLPARRVSTISPTLLSPPRLNLTPTGSSDPKQLGVTVCGPIHESTPMSLRPIRGGYGEALRWSGKALLRCPPFAARLDAIKDSVVDMAWRSAPYWRRDLEIRLGLVGGALLLQFQPTREFIRKHVHGQKIGLGFLGINWLGVEARLGIDGDWGGVLHFNIQSIVQRHRSR